MAIGTERHSGDDAFIVSERVQGLSNSELASGEARVLSLKGKSQPEHVIALTP